MSAFALWEPSNESDFQPFGYWDDAVQQMRDFRGVLAVDHFRSTPTPTPTPTPNPNGPAYTYVVNLTFGSSVNSHPLAEYFGDVATQYSTHGYKQIARVLRRAGPIVENLITATGKDRFTRARLFAVNLSDTAAFAPRSYEYFPDKYFNTIVENGGFITTSHPDYRAIALFFAQDLRRATANASAHRPLFDGIPRRIRKPRIAILFQVLNTQYIAIQATRTDVSGQRFVTPLSNPQPTPSPWYSNSYSLSGSSGFLSFTDIGTPTPSPTP